MWTMMLMREEMEDGTTRRNRNCIVGQTEQQLDDKSLFSSPRASIADTKAVMQTARIISRHMRRPAMVDLSHRTHLPHGTCFSPARCILAHRTRLLQ